MIYREFIDILGKTQTKQVKAIAFPSSCAITRIPRAFNILLPCIVQCIQAEINSFCSTNELIAIFGLQMSSGTVQTEMPKKLHRIYDKHHSNYHLCCVLSYLILPIENSTLPEDWQNSRSILIDFTSGEIMDGERYLSLVFNHPVNGKLYGTLPEKLLTKAWGLAYKENNAKTKTEDAVFQDVADLNFANGVAA